jgi:hypothetical protein
LVEICPNQLQAVSVGSTPIPSAPHTLRVRAEKKRKRAENERVRAEKKRMRAEKKRMRVEIKRIRRVRAEKKRMRAEKKRFLHICAPPRNQYPYQTESIHPTQWSLSYTQFTILQGLEF